MTDFGTDGSTYWPRELWPCAVYYATANALLSNEDIGLAQGWFAKAQDEVRAKGGKASFVSKGERGA